MAFVNLPGRVYSAPVTWHEGLIYRVEAPAGVYNHTLDIANVAINSQGSSHGNAFIRESFGGPYPGTDGTQCAWSRAVLGYDLDAFWTGSCPPPDGPGDTGGVNGSTWDTSTPPSSFGANDSDADAGIGGFAYRPWNHRTWNTPWLDDDDLEDEYLDAESAAFAALPGTGWFLEWEQYYPTFMGIEFAPDETIEGPIGLRTEGITWYYDPVGWGLYGVDEDLNGIWAGQGVGASGSVLTTYAGGLAEWQTFPSDAWLPTQDLSHWFDAGGFIEPEDDTGSLFPLSVAADTVYEGGAYPGDNVTGGRENQWLVFRLAWQTPRFRFYREGEPEPVRKLHRRDDRGRLMSANRPAGNRIPPEVVVGYDR